MSVNWSFIKCRLYSYSFNNSLCVTVECNLFNFVSLYIQFLFLFTENVTEIIQVFMAVYNYLQNNYSVRMSASK